ncbi:M23 family metallopeptidase [Photobacterium lipolyticum]|uniref:Peptidase M23 n=1 Tax=Photobacterium lipolyticum TaxID=266810 RepID=A0A2T3N1P9_9GAMM|nr:M23 family metallopeptidase [Photobacterium lipolyticum]PSW06232.1 peptidase M23 [Photobacterium lipolyticum]
MKDQLVISVSNINGSRHFQFGKFFKRNLAAASLCIAMTIIVTAFVINYLVVEIGQSRQSQQQLNAQSDQLASEITQLEGFRRTLQQDLAERNDELEQVTGRVGDLEQALGIESENELPLNDRLDTAAVNSVVRLSMLQLIPNGSPIKYQRMSSGFGKRVHPVKGQKLRHLGIDLSAKTGTPVRAPADGVVELVRPSKKGYGNLIKIIHAYGFMTLYAHLDSFNVKSGDFIHKGDIIARTGNSGISTGPHLHYEVRFLGRALNPKSFIDWDSANFEVLFDHERSIRWDSLVKILQVQASTQLQLSLHKAVQSPETLN